MTMTNCIIVEFDLDKRSTRLLDVAQLMVAGLDTTKLYWIHIDLSQQSVTSSAFKQIAKTLQLPEKVMELCHCDDTMPKLFHADETVTLQIQCLISEDIHLNHEEKYSNLIMHLTNLYCFTASEEDVPAVREFAETYDKALKYALTPCFIFFLILDNAVNDYAKILYSFELVVEQMDLKIRAAHQNIYDEVMHVKKELMKIKRYTVAIREILMRLSGRRISVISNQCRSSLYNLFNQSQMVFHESDSVRDMLNGLLDQIDYSLMQKMNETMRVLTAFAAIFLPLSLIAGIYGMNFHYMPELQWKYGYYWALSLIVFIGGVLYCVFKYKKWF